MSDSPEPNTNHDAIDTKRKSDLIDKALEVMGADFDSVIILATYATETGGTGLMNRHSGNFHAQNGSMRHILKRRESVTENQVRQDMEDGSE